MTFSEYLDHTDPNNPFLETLFLGLRHAYQVGGHEQALVLFGEEVAANQDVGQMLLVVYTATITIRSDSKAWKQALAYNIVG